MNQPTNAQPDYGNWVSTRLIYAPAVSSLVFLALAFLFPPSIIIAAVFLLVAAYFVYARRLFSPQGGNVQQRVWDLLLAHLDWDGQGQALDIGCGNAALTIAVAGKYPAARVIGSDYWGGNWEYSKGVCENNARLAGVADRLSFQKASAAALPFDDCDFDATVSNLCFHEVSDARDKREVIREALRVVRPGGKFAFQDLFLLEREYGAVEDLLATIRSWGIGRVEFVKTCDAPFIPRALKLPFMVGTMGLIRGEK